MDATRAATAAPTGPAEGEAGGESRHHGLRSLLAGRSSSVYRRLALEAVLVAAMAVAVFRVPSASRDVSRALDRIDTARLGWLPAGVLCELAAFACYAEAQRRLLAAGGARLSRRTLLATTLGANAINLLVPLGALPAGGWTVARYREHDAPTSLALWAVLAGGFTATVAVLALAIVGAALADVAGLLVLAVALAVLLAGAAGFVAAVHRLPAIDRRLQCRASSRSLGRLARFIARTSARAQELIGWRAGTRQGAMVIVCSVGNWLGEAACLATAFAIVGYPVPWRSLLFAFAVSQLAGSLVPLPGGLGAVEGGLVGVLTVTGTPVGEAISATIVFRVMSYWAVAATGAIILALRARRSSSHRTEDHRAARPPRVLAPRPGAARRSLGPPAPGVEPAEAATSGATEGRVALF